MKCLSSRVRPAEHGPGTPGRPPPPAACDRQSHRPRHRPRPRFSGGENSFSASALPAPRSGRTERAADPHTKQGWRYSGGARGHGGPCGHLQRAGTRSPGHLLPPWHTRAGRAGAAPLSQLGKSSCSRTAPHSHPPPAPTFSLRWAPPRLGRGPGRFPKSMGLWRGQSIRGLAAGGAP